MERRNSTFANQAIDELGANAEKRGEFARSYRGAFRSSLLRRAVHVSQRITRDISVSSGSLEFPQDAYDLGWIGTPDCAE